MIPLPGVTTSLGNVRFQESSALLTHILKAFITWNWQRRYQNKIVSWFRLAWGHRFATGEQESIFMQSPSFKSIMCYDFLFTLVSLFFSSFWFQVFTCEHSSDISTKILCCLKFLCTVFPPQRIIMAIKIKIEKDECVTSCCHC